jgi:hypothetical protein
MSLLKSASTIAGSSVISQLIGALSIWLISHKYDMAGGGALCAQLQHRRGGRSGVYLCITAVNS